MNRENNFSNRTMTYSNKTNRQGANSSFYDVSTLRRELREISADKSIQDKVSASFRKIESYIQNGYCTVQNLLAEISQDHNWLGSDVIIQLVAKRYITEQDLLQAGIQPDFVNRLRAAKNRVPLSSNVVPEPITDEGTEIFFWGMPSSGKTCALCAILGTMKNGGVINHMDTNTQMNGYAYIKMATDMFKTSAVNNGSNSSDVTLLPLGTSELAFYELGMRIIDKDMMMHPIVCIDMAGETIRTMYKANAGQQLEDYQNKTLYNINDILTNKHKPGNRMLHIFVIEYGGESRRYEGLDQSTLLESAIEYLESLKIKKKRFLLKDKQYGIFEGDTDGIYIMVTKSDKMNVASDRLAERTMNYVKTYYENFFNKLNYICQRYNINGGRVLTIPFSIGDTCFQDYCKFDSTAARKFVQNIMINRTYGRLDRKIDFLRN